jgi:hypothetical protein
MQQMHTPVEPTRIALYFPSINIPSGAWLSSALLYWDGVGSIVPSYRSGSPWGTTPIMQRLKQANVYREYPADSLFEYGMEHDALYQEFVAVVGTPEFAGRSQLAVDDGIPYKIHADKLAVQIKEYLSNAGLVYSLDGPWYEIESSVAMFYMSLLAKHLAGTRGVLRTGESVVASTDRPDYMDLLYEAIPSTAAIPCLAAKFVDLLPVPQPGVDVHQILEFKSKCGRELDRFQVALGAVKQDLREAEDIDDLNERVLRHREEIVDGVRDLSSKLNGEGITTILSSVSTLIQSDTLSQAIIDAGVKLGTGTTAVSAVGATGVAGAAVAIPLWVGPAVAFGTIASVSLLTYWLRLPRQRRQILRESDNAYLYLAEKEGIINRNWRV